jgi:type IV pilus assembly protein PilB
VTHPFHHRPLGEILIERGFASRADVESALTQENGQLEEVLLRNHSIRPEHLAQALAEQCHLPYVDLNGFTITPELFALLPADHAYQHHAIPYRNSGRTLQVVVANPLDLTLPDMLERITRRPVELAVSSAEAIAEVLKRSEGTAQVLRGMTEEFRILKVVETEEGREKTVALDDLGEDAKSPVVKLINTLLLAAIQKRASDVHIEAYEHGVTVKYRIDGVLYPATETLDRRHHAALVSRLKVMAELDIAEKRIPQDGRFRLRVNGRDIDFRISVLPAALGEDVVIRILDKSSVADGVRKLRLEALGIASETLKRFRKAIAEPYGMVLITGPTGSGKTTTLYAALSELHTGEEKVITIEDPVEYQLDGIVQIAVNEKKGLTFARGLRSILRHDPDKIMVGEIRDAETAQIAVQSALTGHLVFTTVHANNSIDVIGRITHMGIDLYNFVTALNCVMAQRLVRMICPQCRHEVRLDAELLEQSGLDARQHASHTWYEGRGCEHCHGTGYRGRNAVTEFLALTPRIRQLIIDRRPADELQKVAIEEGMSTLRQSALVKALAGETTLKEINRVTFVE